MLHYFRNIWRKLFQGTTASSFGNTLLKKQRKYHQANTDVTHSEKRVGKQGGAFQIEMQDGFICIHEFSQKSQTEAV